MEKEELEKLLATEDEQLQELNTIVLQAIEEEKLLSQKLKEFEDQNPPFTGKIADRVAVFGGSWKFIITFVVFLVLWISINVFLLTQSFDPYPFILLNLLLSALAALQAPVIMMSQNRKEEKDRQRAINDYLVNLKSEVEIRLLLQKLDLLIAGQMKTLFKLQKAQMEMLKDISDKVNYVHRQAG